MNNKRFIYVLLAMLAISTWLSIYVIWSQAKQIDQLEQQLQHEKLKYEIITNDPLTRDAMEAGG